MENDPGVRWEILSRFLIKSLFESKWKIFLELPWPIPPIFLNQIFIKSQWKMFLCKSIQAPLLNAHSKSVDNAHGTPWINSTTLRYKIFIRNQCKCSCELLCQFLQVSAFTLSCKSMETCLGFLYSPISGTCCCKFLETSFQVSLFSP